VEERKLHCSRRRQRGGDQLEACYAQQREGRLQQEQQHVREWPKLNRGERAIYSRSNSMCGSGVLLKLHRREKLFLILLSVFLHSHTRIKNIKNVTRCRDSRSAKSIETR